MEAANAIGCDLAAEVAAVFGSVRLRVSGTSMVPTLWPGDLVSVEKTGIAEILPGEVAVFARNGRLIVHRVLSKIQCCGESYLVTRGDRARGNDAPVSSSEFVGRVAHASSRLNLGSPALSRLLSFSDRGTHLYLRFASRWRELFSRRIACGV